MSRQFVSMRILSPEQAAQGLTAAQALNWQDGKLTAGSIAASVKDNQQADFGAKETAQLARDIVAKMYETPMFMSYCRPKAVHGVLVNRHTGGGRYGAHIDNVFTRGGGNSFRRDLSFTLGLAPKDSFEGGELVMYDGAQTYSYKPDAGEIVVYSSGLIHEVKPVTEGERVCCVGWIESWVVNMEQRLALLDFDNVINAIGQAGQVESEQMLKLQACRNNFLRLFSG